MPLEQSWHPCLWCGGPIGERRVKDAIMRRLEPKYCGDRCRRNERAASFIVRVFGAALGASRHDETAWEKDFNQRIELAAAPYTYQRKGRAK